LLEHAFRAARRSGSPSAVFFLDLDRFKQVNDTYEHQVGDALLVAVAQRLTGALRPGDSLARLSGDEFVVLCPDLADRSAADPIAARLDAELSRPFALSGVEVTITASIGIAFTGRGIDEPRGAAARRRPGDRPRRSTRDGRPRRTQGTRRPDGAG
jgi:diguanylate cyclase (GGDEF)-like protein